LPALATVANVSWLLCDIWTHEREIRSEIMGKAILFSGVIMGAIVASTAWSQTNATDFNGTNPDGGTSGGQNLGDPNPNLGNPDPRLDDPNPNLGDPNPHLGGANPTGSGSNLNPTMNDNSASPFGASNVRRGDVNAQGMNNSQNISGSAAIDNNWRMVQHNGRWWYWTPENTWLLRRGNQWEPFQSRADARRTYSGQTFNGQRQPFNGQPNGQRQRVGYRGDGTFDAQAGTQGTADPRFNDRAAWNGNARTNVRGGTGTNFSDGSRADGSATFNGTRPPLPTGAELQRFQAQQQNLAAPYGGTMGGARNQTPLGGGATRSGTFGTGTGGVGSPGNPSAIPQSAPGNTGNPATSGGATATGGIGTAPGTSGVGGTGGTTGGGAGAGGTGGGAGGGGAGGAGS
jgi:hypothetical protein